ncbi:MAG: hypothetical protein RL701_3820 [Pseudomonadota bacterium]
MYTRSVRPATLIDTHVDYQLTEAVVSSGLRGLFVAVRERGANTLDRAPNL